MTGTGRLTRSQRPRWWLVPIAALLAMIGSLTAVSPAQAGFTNFASTVTSPNARFSMYWQAPLPAGEIYVVIQSTTNGHTWVFQTSSDVADTQPSGDPFLARATVTADLRNMVSASCTTLCFTAKVGGTASTNYLPNDLYQTQAVYVDTTGTVVRSAASSLSTTVFTGTPVVSNPMSQSGMAANTVDIDFELPAASFARSPVITFSGRGTCSASTASVRFLNGLASNTPYRLRVTYDSLAVTGSTRQAFSVTASPTAVPYYAPVSTASPVTLPWTPGEPTSSASPSPSWSTPAWTSPTSTPAFTPVPMSSSSLLVTSSSGKLIRGCSYDVNVEWLSFTRLPGYPDQEPYTSQFSTWYNNSTASPVPTQTGVCATPSVMYTTSPSPSCSGYPPAGHKIVTDLVVPDVPDAPTGVSTGYADGALPIYFTAPDDNYAAITGYEYSLDGGLKWTSFQTPAGQAPYTVTGLTNGQEYSVQIRAVNGVGGGVASQEVKGTPMTFPAAPSGVDVVREDGAARVSITGPVSNGGSEITEYQYSLNDGDWTSGVPAFTTPSFTIEDLTNGTPYDVRVRAVNSVGPGPASDSVQVTPCGAPGAPASLSLTPQDRAVQVVAQGAQDNGCQITEYQYRLDDGDWTAAGDATGAFTITGLTNGTAYEVRVRAGNDVGMGADSRPEAVTPGAVPGAPDDLVYTVGSGGGSVSFSGPDPGGREIIGYQFQSGPGQPWVDVEPPATTSPVTLRGLTNGTTYQVRIRAVNSIGPGAPSDVVPVTPGAVPGAPRDVVGVPGDGSARVTWSAPPDDGGWVITDYEYRVDSGAWVSAGGPSATVTGLTNGTTYQVRIRAVNSIGPGAPSDVVPVTPGAVPGAPRDVVGVPGDGSARVTWSAPPDDGGRVITDYEYRVDSSAWVKAGGPSATVTGLTNGQRYQIAVRAVNALGPGPASDAVSVTPVGGQRQAQVVDDPRARPPGSIPAAGVTVLTPRDLRTDVGQPIRTDVRVRVLGVTAQGEVRYFRVIRGPQRKVSLRTYGYRDLRVVVLRSAPATGDFRAYRKRIVYVRGVRQ